MPRSFFGWPWHVSQGSTSFEDACHPVGNAASGTVQGAALPPEDTNPNDLTRLICQRDKQALDICDSLYCGGEGCRYPSKRLQPNGCPDAGGDADTDAKTSTEVAGAAALKGRRGDSFLCAESEGLTCKCTGTVYYGQKYVSGRSGTGWTTTLPQLLAESHKARNVVGVVPCTDRALGGDPLPGAAKHCYCKPGASDPDGYEPLATACQMAKHISGGIKILGVVACAAECDKLPNCVGFDTDGEMCYPRGECEGPAGECRYPLCGFRNAERRGKKHRLGAALPEGEAAAGMHAPPRVPFAWAGIAGTLLGQPPSVFDVDRWGGPAMQPGGGPFHMPGATLSGLAGLSLLPCGLAALPSSLPSRRERGRLCGAFL